MSSEGSVCVTGKEFLDPGAISTLSHNDTFATLSKPVGVGGLLRTSLTPCPGMSLQVINFIFVILCFLFVYKFPDRRKTKNKNKPSLPLSPSFARSHKIPWLVTHLLIRTGLRIDLVRVLWF